MTKPKKLRIYTVVDVWRGLANGSRSFVRLDEARNHLRRVQKGRNLQEDDVRLFENTIELPRRIGLASSRPIPSR